MPPELSVEILEFLRPARPRLQQVLLALAPDEVLSYAEEALRGPITVTDHKVYARGFNGWCHITDDPQTAWEILVARGLLPLEAAEAPERRYLSEQPLFAYSHPASITDACALAAAWTAVLTAEALVQEAWGRLIAEPTGTTQQLWCVQSRETYLREQRQRPVLVPRTPARELLSMLRRFLVQCSENPARVVDFQQDRLSWTHPGARDAWPCQLALAATGCWLDDLDPDTNTLTLVCPALEEAQAG